MIKEYKAAGKLHEELFSKIDLIISAGCKVYKVIDLAEDYFVKNKLKRIHASESITININSTVYHGVDTGLTLESGDVLTVDICFICNGVIIDGAKTYTVGIVDRRVSELIDVNREVIAKVLEIVEPGVKVCDLLKFISDYVSIRGFYLFPEGLGHGIGKNLHEPPYLSLTDLDYLEYEFVIGDVFTIEPILFLEPEDVKVNVLGEGIISEGNYSSQFEVTICIDINGDVEVLNRGLLK